MRINLSSVASGVTVAEKITGVKTFVEPIVGSITGSAGSANKLSVARTINGVPFDGTADITITDNTKISITDDLDGGEF